jgi:hypothetical protein
VYGERGRRKDGGASEAAKRGGAVSTNDHRFADDTRLGCGWTPHAVCHSGLCGRPAPEPLTPQG